jgi:membrane protease YdiL (CAAX protease family)
MNNLDENPAEVVSVESASFLDNARLGKGSVWRYLLGTLLILFIWLIVGGVATVVLILVIAVQQGRSLESIARLAIDPSELGSTAYFLILSASFIIMFLGIWLTVILVHRRSLLSVITAARTVDWRRVGVGFVAWLLLIALGTLAEYLIWPDTYSWNFVPGAFLPFALLAILLTPIQTSSEELFFRGYLVQAGSLLSRNGIFLSIWSGVLFALPHMTNPEVAANFVIVLLTYFVLGAFLAWVSIKDGTLELALGVHVSNNLFAALVVTFPDSVLPTPAIFFTTHFDPYFSLIAQIVVCALFYLVCFTIFRKKSFVGTLEIAS